MTTKIIEKLTQLGFSRYESAAYISLLEIGPATAYEAAKNAGLPSSKIYEVLAKLTERGLVLEMHENSRKRYTALESDDFLSKYRRDLNHTMDSLACDLKNLKGKSNVSYIWNIDSWSDLLEIAKEAIKQCRKELLLSLWPREAQSLGKELAKAHKNNIAMASVYFGKDDFSLGQVYPHPIEDTLYQEKSGRGFTLVADSKLAIMATVQEKDSCQGAWSRSGGFITLAEDYIKHDIYIMKIVSRFDAQLIKTFGPKYKHLRNIFSDQEV
ncbi:MAG: TrmB family transcriptional regulator [Spirochaetales bacterium]|nr:TrmB family transcriptional regulator [Spirochaetales bacterium]